MGWPGGNGVQVVGVNLFPKITMINQIHRKVKHWGLKTLNQNQVYVHTICACAHWVSHNILFRTIKSKIAAISKKGQLDTSLFQQVSQSFPSKFDSTSTFVPRKLDRLHSSS